MKKFLVLLMMMVILAGSLTPCHADDGCHAENCEPISPEQEKNDWGSCSPFFTCGSCVGFLQPVKYHVDPGPETESTIYHEKIVAHFFSSYIPSFFKPPQHSPEI